MRTKVALWKRYKGLSQRLTEATLFCRRALARILFGIDERRCLFIACFPKSGSTYLMRLLCEITCFPRLILVQFMGPNEQDLLEAALRKRRYRDGVVQQHVKATKYNLRLMKEYGIRPVVLVRDIQDVVVSLCDHIEGGGPPMPTGYTHRAFFEMSREDKWMFLIRVHIPWYFSFLMSWGEAEGQIPVRWTSYETLFEDQEEEIVRLLEYWDVPIDRKRIAKGMDAVKDKPTRLNKGVTGRGARLGQRHKSAIREIADACALDGELRARIGLD